jgi:predicted nucleic acid-binding protein
VLDSEALSAVTWPQERSRSTLRAQAVLEAVVRLGGRAVVPAPVLAEVARTTAKTAAIGRVLRRIPVIATDRPLAERAGALLEAHRLNSCHAVDAFVAATAIANGYSLVITGDPQDLHRLTADATGVTVQPLP